jgi:hypothetical protein
MNKTANNCSACDVTPTIVSLISIMAALIAALTFQIVAGILNGGFFTAPASPGFMLASLATLGGAALATGLAIMFFGQYKKCVSDTKSMGTCGGNFANADNALSGLAAAISAAIACCAAATPVSWIPWLGEAPIAVAIAGTGVAITACGVALGYCSAAASCASKACKLILAQAAGSGNVTKSGN